MSHEQPKANEVPKNPVEAGTLPDTTAEKAAVEAKLDADSKKSKEGAATLLTGIKSTSHEVPHGGEEKKAGPVKTMAKNFAIGGGVVAGGFLGLIFAGAWKLVGLYKEAFGIKSGGGGGGSKKSSSSGGHGGGGGGGGHH